MVRDSSKLDEILLLVTNLNSRLAKMEACLDSQSIKIKNIEERGNIANEFVRLQLGLTRETTFHSNMLIGETDTRPRSASLEERQKRKAKQHFGANIYLAYLLLYAFLMFCSFVDLLPIYSWEIQTFPVLLALADQLRDHMYVPFMLSFLYVLGIFSIQRYMREKTAFKLRGALAGWSLFLGVFSLIGSLRTVPVLLQCLIRNGFTHMICGDSRNDWLYTPAGSWTAVFVLSKVPELIDTLFIVLRKRTLITLHWYHHITVMIFCWHSWATLCLNGLFFSALNLTVHAFMYVFYSLTALGYRPTAYAQFITIMQIVQMVVGTSITAFVVFRLFAVDRYVDLGNMLEPNLNISTDYDPSDHCKINPTNAVAGLIMYGSYLWLFCVFYYYAYIIPKRKKKVE